MRAAGLEDVDPQAVELELLAELEPAFLRERRDMLVEQPDQIGEARVAVRQVVERRVGGVAAIAMLLRPVAPGLVLLGEIAAGIGEFGDQRVVPERLS